MKAQNSMICMFANDQMSLFQWLWAEDHNPTASFVNR